MVDGKVLNKERLDRMLDAAQEVYRRASDIRAENLHDLVKVHEARNVAECASTVYRSALDRTESREQFFRDDYPMTDPSWLCWHAVTRTRDGIRFERLGVPTEGARLELINMNSGLGPIGAIIRGEQMAGHAA